MGYYDINFRQRVLEYYLEEESTQQEVCDIFDISLSSFKRWLCRYRKGEGLYPLSEGKGRPFKVDEKGEKLIKALVESNPSITLEEISKIYYKKKKVVAGRSVISRVLHRLNLRHKKLSIYAAEQDHEEVKKKEINI